MARRQSSDPGEFKHTHYYNPVGWDRFDPRVHPGSRPIQPGARIQNLGTFPGGPKAGRMTFHHIRDEQDNHQSVFRASLQSKRAAMSSPEDAMRWDPSAGEAEMKEWGSIFNDRRGNRG